MPPIPVMPGVYRCVLTWSMSGRPDAINVIHVGAAETEAGAVVGELQTAWQPGMTETVSNAARLVRISAQELDGLSAPFEDPTPAETKFQGGGGEEFDPQIAGLIRLRTAFSGKRFNGRVYLPFAAEADRNAGRWDAPKVSEVSTAWTLFRTSLAAADIVLGVASYTEPAFTPALTSLLDPVTATQRRRHRRS